MRASGYDRAQLAPHVRATEIGSAAEHIVVADLLLAGFRAFMAGAQLPYDVVVDVDGKLLRVAVKGSLKASPRPARENSRLCYQFRSMRSSRLSTGKTVASKYGVDEVDLFAFVALDIRKVAYARMTAAFPCIWHVDPPGAYVPSANGWGPKKPRGTRKTFDGFPLMAALRSLSS